MDYADPYFLLTLGLSVAIILAAYVKGKIDSSAVLASGLVGFLVMFSLSDKWFLIYLVLAFFALGNLVTRYRFSVKAEYKVAEGVRTFLNVFGNGGAATIFSVIFFFSHLPFMLFGVLGAMATATADTFATEVGQAHERKPRMITNLKKVEVGTSGAVSSHGLAASLVGAFLVSLIPAFFGFGLLVVAVGTLAGFLGCVVDSFIGATLEKKLMDTHLTNFIATFFGGVFAILLGVSLGAAI
jgi:uncharacterized protein (TIGR00297 family)